MQLISTVQIGKNGMSENTIETIKGHFKNHQNVKVVLLKSSKRDRDKIKKIADEILKELGKNYTYRVVGFTIFLKKWRKAQR
ncbi:MAG: YhbY family RNA-binding protein [Candidatus Pacearchaeota archaeon]|jgi:RNA-binding protein YhbY